jgi:hypothetical protein
MMQIVVSDAPLKLADDLKAQEVDFLLTSLDVLAQVGYVLKRTISMST